MIFSLALITISAFGGLALTYVFAEDKRFLWRLAAGNIIGSAVFGLVGFVAACFFGLSTGVVAIALLVAASPAILFAKKKLRNGFSQDWQTAKEKLENADLGKILRFAYYSFFFLLFWFFFGRAMFATGEGIFTGGSQNLGDLPFHLGAIFSFTDGANFPPQNPSFAGAKFSYPFIADFLTACYARFGAGVADAMRVQNVFWAFSLLVILEEFVFKITNSRSAGKLAPALLFFSGGLGFLWFFSDFRQQTKDLTEFLFALPRDYTIGEKFSWGNSLTTLFITQRSLLIGMPLTIIVLQKLWEIFSGETPRREEEINNDEQDKQNEKTLTAYRLPLTTFYVGLLAGMLPLIHLHSLVVLFVVAAFLFFFRIEKWRDWIAFGLGVAIVAVPELAWSMSGSATRTSEFFAWHFGWNKKPDENFLWFWLKNTGLFVPLLILGIYLIWGRATRGERREIENDEQNAKVENQNAGGEETISSLVSRLPSALLFFVPFAFLFVVSNVAKLAPWEWDNVKVLIYWFVASLPFVAAALVWLWRANVALKVFAAVCFAALISAGALDVWRVVSGQINYKVFDSDAVKIAEQIKLKTPKNALFLNAPTYNSAVVLSGRRSLMRYLGHLSSHGINYAERENDLKRIYAGDATAPTLLQKHDIEYVLISPEERSASLAISEEFFAKYPVIAESGQYRVYKVK